MIIIIMQAKDFIFLFGVQLGITSFSDKESVVDLADDGCGEDMADGGGVDIADAGGVAIAYGGGVGTTDGGGVGDKASGHG